VVRQKPQQQSIAFANNKVKVFKLIFILNLGLTMGFT
jgi:hypothetical protein